MKPNIFHLMAVCFVVTANEANAQGTLYLSNLGEAVYGGETPSTNLWFAHAFTTGVNSGGYSLDAVQLLINFGSPLATSFTVSVRGNSGTGSGPGAQMGVLSGPVPTTNGVFSYSAANISLAPVTTYWVAVTADNPDRIGTRWSDTTSTNYASIGGWQLATDNGMVSLDGINWSARAGTSPSQFAITATAIPEPSVVALFFLGGGWLAWAFRGRKH